jgi:hypothetical protein
MNGVPMFGYDYSTVDLGTCLKLLIAVSSFGESLRWVALTAPAEAAFSLAESHLNT